jgi:multidrug efflux pump subunit AcrA (membrane-fusion protein)
MFRKRAFWIVLAVVVFLAGGGYVATAAGWTGWLAPQGEVLETTLETSTVTVGDISITADGTGVLVAASSVDLAFGSSGTLMELLVEVGDVVEAGDVLGWIDDTDARKTVVDAELSVLQAEGALEDAQDTAALEQAFARAELEMAQTEADLETAVSELQDLIEWAPDETDVEIAQANLTIAQADYQVAVAKANMRDEETTSVRVNLEQAIRDLEEAQADYANAMDAARDWERNIEDTRARAAETLQKVQDSLAVAQASYNLNTIDTSSTDVQNAWVVVLNAQDTLDDLQTPPEASEITQAELVVQELEVALRQAELDLADAQAALDENDVSEAELTLEQARLKLESAQVTLEGTTLVAPVTGTVVEVNAQVGETVNGTAVVLADLAEPVVQFWVEESDLNSVAVGNRVQYVFEALPDLVYEGEITDVDPVLVTVDSTTAVQSWASIDTSAHPVKLLGDMNVEVEVVAGEALNAVLAPVQALRELGEDQYAVFVVRPEGATSGELELRMVEVGLQDYVHAEILSGLQSGEVVSVGEATSSSNTSTSSAPSEQPPADGMMMRMLGG